MEAAAMKQTKSRALDASKYTVPDKMGRAERIAHYLDWSAVHYPHQFTAYNILTKVVNNFPRTPHMDSKDVMLVRSTLPRVRKLLQKEYSRDVVTSPGTGVRATVESNDAVAHTVRRAVNRIDSATAAAVAAASVVKPRELVAGENKAWFMRVQSTLNQLSAPEFTKRFLPPALPGEPPAAKVEEK